MGAGAEYMGASEDGSTGTQRAASARPFIGLRLKMFVALLVSIVLAVVATGIAARFAFLWGFLGYLNHQEAAHVRPLLVELAGEYRKHGDWEFLRDNPRAWFETLGRVEFGRELPRDVFAAGPPFLPPSALASAPPISDRPPPAGFPMLLRPPGLGMRLALLDSQRHWVVGGPAVGKDALEGALLQAIEVQGRVVGWVSVLPFNQVTAGAADAFQRQQLMLSWITGVIAVGLAAILSVVLTARILKPIRSLAAATHRLAAGDYSTRLTVDSPDEIGRLAADFNRMALAMERNEAMRRTLVADVSHELRTPVAILQAELEAMSDEVRHLSVENLKSLQGEVAILGKLINDLYDLSLTDVGALAYRMSRVDLAEILRWRLLAFQERYAERAIAIEADIPERTLYIEADEIRIQQLFNNLLENSLRYTDSGGRLRVHCHVQSDRVRVDLEDSAPGVSAELLPRLFERFFRVDSSRNRASGGAGLGLAIARSVVEAHGGGIHAAGSPLGGLWVRLSLPLAK
jgi:two-component system sensor histidine kinase BaeS